MSAIDARRLVTAASIATMATIDARTGHPYASLVQLAATTGGTPLLLISRLALHTQNLVAEPRGSLLVDERGKAGAPLASGRATLLGQFARSIDPMARQVFLEKHPDAAVYADFADFGVWTMTIERVHWIGGFGRITDISGDDYRSANDDV